MDLTPLETKQNVNPYDQVDDEVKQLLTKAIATNTKRGYQADWKHFENWCFQNNHTPIPASPESIAIYLKDMLKNGYVDNHGNHKDYKVSSFERRLAAISQIHQAMGCKQSPTHELLVRNTMKGIRRTIGTHQTRKAPAEIDVIRMMIETQDLETLIGVRNQALLVIGFSGALRRSELVAIDVEHLEFTRNGIKVFIPRSKTDQDGQGYKIGLPYGSNPATCPVRTVQDWMEISGIHTGPLFRRVDRYSKVHGRLTAQSVRLIVRKAAEKAGLDPNQFAGHSLRSGFITTSYLAGKNERAIMKQSRHQSLKVMRSYIREADIFKDNAATGIGL